MVWEWCVCGIDSVCGVGVGVGALSVREIALGEWRVFRALKHSDEKTKNQWECVCVCVSVSISTFFLLSFLVCLSLFLLRSASGLC